MTKLELRVKTRQLLGGRTDGVLTDAWYDERVLNGYRALLTYQGPSTGPGTRQGGRILKFLEHESRVTRTLNAAAFATDNFIANQAGTLIVTDIWDRTNKTGLTLATEIDMKRYDPDAIGPVRVWRPAGKAGIFGYYVYPRPTLTAHAKDIYEYVITQPTLTADSDSPLIGAEWHMSIAYAAASEGAGLLDAPEMEKDLKERFVNAVGERITLPERVQFSGHAGMRGSIATGY